MPIYELTENDVEHRCAVCELPRRVTFNELSAADEGANALVTGAVVRLPACAQCGAVEFLVRTAEDEPPHPSPGSFGHLHRVLVDALHAALASNVGVGASARTPSSSAARGLAANELDQWFPNGLKIENESSPASSAIAEVAA